MWGLSMAATMRRVIGAGSILSLEWTLATTMSSRPSRSGSWSSAPSSKMSTSMPVRIRKGASSAFNVSTTSSWRTRRSGSRPWATVSLGLWSVSARYS